MNRAAGSRSFKAAIAYDRTLAVDPVPRSEAERIFGRASGRRSRPAERKAFGDYIIRHFLDRARDLGLVFQVHTGLARLAGSNPLLLEPLLQDFPTVVFDLFHGGYPWIHDVAALAHNHPNVRLNLTWLPQLSTSLAAEALKEWLQVVPQVDRITWGADCFLAEEMYGSLLAARDAIARALTDLVEEDYLPMETALDAVAQRPRARVVPGSTGWTSRRSRRREHRAGRAGRGDPGPLPGRGHDRRGRASRSARSRAHASSQARS